MKTVFEGKWFTVKTNEEFRKVFNEYNIDTKCFKNVDTVEDFINNCIEIRESCWYKTYFIQLDINNKNIYWIGLDQEGDSFGAVTLYKNENLKPSILCDVMTFAEATEKWGLGESTLRSTVRTDRLQEGIDYKKSGKVWLITFEAMLKIYGEPKIK